jgi:hypothetical protein
MSEPPRLRVSFASAPAEEVLFAKPRENGVPLAWQSTFIPPYDDFLNLDGFIVLDLVNGAVEAVEILHLQNHGARSAAANDFGHTHKMFVDLSNRQDVEREVTIFPQRDGADLVFVIEKVPASDRCIPIGGGLGALVAGDALSGLRVFSYYG